MVGYTTQEHLLVDLDKMSEARAYLVAKMITSEFRELGSCLIVKSSDFHYHLIYDVYHKWDHIVYIVKLLADVGLVQKNYAQVRTFRRDLTLRVSPKKGEDYYRPAPEPILILLNPQPELDEGGIGKYLNMLSMFKSVSLEDIGHEWIK